ncbi:MAG: hypothetical protein ABJN36_03350 [Cyclobacteriaceae bacterium]
MKAYLKSIVSQLKNYSLSLDKMSILIDKPWALIDEESEIQKLIFKKNKELIMSKNGQVQEGKWDYFPEAKSLLIDRISDKILCNEAFIDKGIMILKLDGTENRFFMLANENVVPDLDVNSYLKELRYQKLKISEVTLSDGRILEVQKEADYALAQPDIGNAVSVGSEPIEDGKYRLGTPNQYFEIVKGKIFKILTETRYRNPNGQETLIQQQDKWKIRKGDYVYQSGKQINDAVLNFSKSKNLVVKNGIVSRLEPKNKLVRWFSNAWINHWNE